MLPPPTTVSGLTAMLPPTPMAPTGTSARGLLMLSPRLMLMLTTALWVTMVWATPTTDTTATGLTPLPPSSTTVSGLTAMLPPTPMAPTGTSARGLLMLSPRLMLMLTTALWATPTTDSTDTGPTLLPPSSTTASGLTAMLPPTPMVPTGISARGPLMLSPRLMLMLTTALWATTVWATPTTDTTDTGPTLPPPTVSGLTAMLPPTPTTTVPTADTCIKQYLLSSK